MKKAISGFTIIELLIVIIVIGILATISTVAYNGAQTRAENTKTINAVTAYVKAFSLYAAEKGTYPYPVPAGANACLGNGWTGSCGTVVTGSPSCPIGAIASSVDASFNSKLAEYSSSFPAMSTQKIACQGMTYSGAVATGNAKTMVIYMFLKGNADCPKSLGTTASFVVIPDPNMQTCIYQMPTLP